MGNHLIHFNRRQIRIRGIKDDPDLWFAREQSIDAVFERPQYHVTRTRYGSAKDIRPDDTIWLIGQLYSPWGKLPPALDARIDIADCIQINESKKTKSYYYKAAPTSRWFPLSDASNLLKSLQTQTQNQTVKLLIEDDQKPIGQFLQRIRKLKSATPLLDWERKLNKGGFDFVSYRILDGTKSAFQKVRSLIENGDVVFWDRWSLPRRLAERREVVSDKALQKYIEKQIENANVVWAINSPLYGQSGSYSAEEMLLAKKLQIYHLVNSE